MKHAAYAWSWLFVALGALGCSGTGQPEVSFSAVAVPSGTKELQVDDVAVTLDEAVVAIGPVYFCAGASGAATLCETAQGEILDMSRVDLLATEPSPLGTFQGFTGTVRSASYDFGVHWFLTEKAPTPAPSAPGGHSAHFAGVARRGAASVRFVADVDVIAQYQGQRAVPTTPAQGRIDEGTARLEVGFDVASWFSGVELGKAIDAGEDPYVIAPGSRDHDALVIGMVSLAPPTFTFRAGGGR
jgi:hypothetical protein